jgi:hypothetical protein
VTVQQLINAALMDIGVLAQGESPSTDESNDALTRANQLLASWSLEGLTAYGVKHESFSLTATTVNYTMGSGGSFSSSGWPVKIVAAAAVNGNFRRPMKVLSFEELRAESADDTGRTDDLPSLLGADRAYPLKNVKIFPPPRSSSTSVEIDSWQPFTAFAALGDTVALAPGYEMALQFELAVALAPSYGRAVTAELAANLTRAKGVIQELNRSIDHPPAAPAQAA